MKKKHISLKNQLAEIETLVCVIEEFGETNDLPTRAMFDMNLVLEEIITNTISYGYGDELEHYIIVDIYWENKVIKLTVSDDGKPFNPLELAEPDLLIPLEEREEGGLGIHFVKQIMDEVTYQWEDGRNVLTMSKDYVKEVT